VPGRTLQVFVIPLADLGGDFTFDGLVDAADFLAWQRGESLDPLSEADLAQWTALFGNASVPLQNLVPEPSALNLTYLVLSGLFFRAETQRRRGRGEKRK
jgi:hypothetical protein